MSADAIFMMVFAIVVIWGGMVASAIFLAKHPEGSVVIQDDASRHPLLVPSSNMQSVDADQPTSPKRATNI